MIDIRNGIAYSGDVNECGTLKEKINHAISNNINYIQVRTKDIQDMIFINGKLDNNKVKELTDLINSYSGTLSIHLPNPIWNYDNIELTDSNELVISTIRDLFISLGIKDYTIHPHFSRQVYENLSKDQKEIMLEKMSDYFSRLSNLGINLAIENIPVRDLNIIKQMPDSEKKKQAEKNISYGMTIEEIEKILNLTKNKTINKDSKVGITYDTGHSLAMINDINKRQKEIEKWIEHFKNDILIYHIAPSVGNNPNKLTKEAIQSNHQLIKWVYEYSQKYNVDALSFVEAHANFNKLTELFKIEKIEKEVINKNNKPLKLENREKELYPILKQKQELQKQKKKENSMIKTLSNNGFVDVILGSIITIIIGLIIFILIK